MALWKWAAGVGAATVSIIAAPVADSLIKEGKFPDGLGAVFSKLGSWLLPLWIWLSGETSMPTWLVLVQTILLIGFLVPLVWLLLPNTRMSEQPESTPLTPEQLAVFMFVGRSIDNGTEPNHDIVIQSVGRSRNATEHALEALSEIGLISRNENFYGADWYLLTNAGRERYLELERSNSGSRVRA